jgi:hypothetical protein
LLFPCSGYDCNRVRLVLKAKEDHGVFSDLHLGTQRPVEIKFLALCAKATTSKLCAAKTLKWEPKEAELMGRSEVSMVWQVQLL